MIDLSQIPNLHVIDHPLIKTRMAKLRAVGTTPGEFRDHLGTIGRLMAYRVTEDLPLTELEVETPLEVMTGHQPARPVVVVSILRAGLGMVEPFQQLLPEAYFGHIGLARNEETLQPESYYCKLPPTLSEADVFLVDPMLATGNSSIEATSQLKAEGASRLRLVCLVSAPEGIQKYHEAHPDVPIYTAVVDRGLNEKGYIVPGLGDAGDRYFGTL
tara:strand:- start:137 stop:781 length:645 start_codon:yes stop_codon:yes gene_type:complete